MAAEAARDQAVRLVVGAAIVRDGRVLAARRSDPPLAGGWEFPGGKVDPGETPEQAVVRECREELGVEIAVGERVGPDVPLGARYLLRVWTAALVAGEPAPLEDHDRLRWLARDELREVAWLPADLPIVEELATRLDGAASARDG